MTTPQTLKGFRDFLPSAMSIRNKVINTFRQVFESYGFNELQTPTLEYASTLLGKYGEEAEKLMYTFSDAGERQVGLKYDLTVPLARVMAQYPDLAKPFKRYQIQPVFRADKPQKGRYREITQCDIDIVGTSAPAADSEILAIISQSLSQLGLNQNTIRVNSRTILFDLVTSSNIPEEKFLTTLQTIDKLDKKSPDEVKAELAIKQLTPSQIDTLFENLKTTSPDLKLQEIITLATQMGATNIQFDPTLVRGLDYYTGIIIETVMNEPKIGSVTGGGRYDNLIKTLGGPDLPAVGTTLGLDRICDVIQELDLWPALASSSTQLLVTVFSPQLYPQSLALAKLLRSQGLNVDLYPDPTTKLDKQLKYAISKSIPFVAIIGPEEIDKNLVTLKNLSTRDQVQATVEQLSEIIKLK